MSFGRHLRVAAKGQHLIQAAGSQAGRVYAVPCMQQLQPRLLAAVACGRVPVFYQALQAMTMCCRRPVPIYWSQDSDEQWPCERTLLLSPPGNQQGANAWPNGMPNSCRVAAQLSASMAPAFHGCQESQAPTLFCCCGPGHTGWGRVAVLRCAPQHIELGRPASGGWPMIFHSCCAMRAAATPVVLQWMRCAKVYHALPKYACHAESHTAGRSNATTMRHIGNGSP